MITRFFKKYLSIVFIVALFAGSFHHHDDIQTHDDCQICTIQSNLLNSDVPNDTIYLSTLDLYSEAIISELVSLHLDTRYKLSHARAPPLFS